MSITNSYIVLCSKNLTSLVIGKLISSCASLLITGYLSTAYPLILTRGLS